MNCESCHTYRYAAKRSTPSPDDEGSVKVKSRFCISTGTCISGQMEVCDKFVPSDKFHCHRYNYLLTVKECMNRHQKRISRKCSNSCKQYKENVELAKCVFFYQRKLTTQVRPILKRRIKCVIEE